jgi:hypothetical protein
MFAPARKSIAPFGPEFPGGAEDKCELLEVNVFLLT